MVALQEKKFPLEELRHIQCEKDATEKKVSDGGRQLDDAQEEFLTCIVERSAATRLQRDGVRFILSQKGRCLIADEMGVGKTLQALLAMWFYRAEFPLLVVCPSTLRGVWRSEAEKWLSALGLKVDKHVQVIKTGEDVYEKGKLIYIISFNLLAGAPKSGRAVPASRQDERTESTSSLAGKSSR
jgi:SNF2 family DNA or RNA helicase